MTASALDRVMARVQIQPNGCWVWTGWTGKGGYGVTRVGGNRRMVTHKVVWEAHHGPVPEGVELDHVGCSNPPCCNPAHLALVTHRQNMDRVRTTYCKRGHEMTPENTYQRASGRRNCRACLRLGEKRRAAQ